MNNIYLSVTMGVILLAGGCSRSPEATEARSLQAGKKHFGKTEYARALLEFSNAAKAVPSDAEPYYQLGLVYLAINDVHAAAASFAKALDLKPSHKEAQLRLAHILANSSDKEAVEDALKRATEILGQSPDDVEARNTAAFAEMRLGNVEKAKSDLEETLKKFPAHFEAALNLARAKLTLKDVAGAEQVLNEAVAKSPGSTVPLTTLGEFYLIIGKPAEAEQRFRKALTIAPADVTALRALGGLQWKAHRMDEADQTYRKLSQVADKRFRSAHAMFLMATEKREKSIAEFETLLKDSPDDRELRTDLVRAYLTADRRVDAENVLAQALKRNASDVDALLQRSQIELRASQYTQAEADIAQVLHFRPDSADAHYLLSKVHEGRGEATTRQQELGETLRLNPEMLAARIEMVQGLIGTQAAQAALKVLDETPASQKSSLAVAIQRNWAWLAVGEREKARQQIDDILKRTRNPEVVLQQGISQFLAQDYEHARVSAEEALKGLPGDVRTLELLMRSYAAQQQPDKGVRQLREYAAERPQNIGVQRYLAQTLNDTGKRAEARKVLEDVKSANAPSLDLNLDLAKLAVADGKLDVARKYLMDAMPLDTRGGRVRGQLAEVEVAAGNYAAAIDLYQQALQADPHNVAALNNLAYLLSDFKQQPDEALRYAQQAKELSPQSSFTDDTLGWTYYRKGMYTMAVKFLETATAHEATARRKYHLAMAYLKMGEHRKGKQTLDAALQMDASLPEAAAARQVLSESMATAKE